MLPDSLFRLLLSVGLVLLGIGVYQAINYLILYKNRNQSGHLDHFKSGRPAILYFTTPDCAPCKTIQRPALNMVETSLGNRLQIIEVNAYDQPDLAKTWGVLSVPTTFILDSHGHPQHVNHGVTPAKKLLEQLEQVK
jgi:thiol-disulfide isomerase/thioredoxin